MGAILLIRHGQASFGEPDYDKLSVTGKEQALVLGRHLRGRLRSAEHVQTGTMRRHQQTAAGCLEGLNWDLPATENAGWNEYDHDEVLNRYKPKYRNRARLVAELASHRHPRRAFQEIFAAAIERWMDGAHDADYAETWPQFRQRCVQALHDLSEQMAKGETALVFTSGGPITAVVQELMGIPAQNIFRINWTLANCGTTKIIHSERGLFLSSLNEHTAFEGDFQDLITYR
nr:histidine phosphatase family protein [Oceanococcus sp. HetDA_MAG_MS8]